MDIACPVLILSNKYIQTFRVFESLLEAEGANQLHEATLGLVHGLGFDSFHYGVHKSRRHDGESARFVFDGIEREQSQWFLSSFSTSWGDHYRSHDYIGIDPLVRHASTSSLPIQWQNCPRTAASEIKLFDEARQHGLSAGTTIPIHSATGEQGLLSLAYEKETHRLSMRHPSVMGQALMLCNYLHEAMRTLDAPKISALPHITSRERECLLWAAVGKTAWETSQILHISERTVVFHLSNVAAKLGATNKRQTIARAVSLRLIQP